MPIGLLRYQNLMFGVVVDNRQHARASMVKCTYLHEISFFFTSLQKFFFLKRFLLHIWYILHANTYLCLCPAPIDENYMYTVSPCIFPPICKIFLPLKYSRYIMVRTCIYSMQIHKCTYLCLYHAPIEIRT